MNATSVATADKRRLLTAGDLGVVGHGRVVDKQVGCVAGAGGVVVGTARMATAWSGVDMDSDSGKCEALLCPGVRVASLCGEGV